jgi:hypothetical protein
MIQHSWKSPDFIKVKRNLQGYILRIILFIKTAVSSNSSLDPGPRAFAGLCHGVPVEEPHHILYLLDQILGFVARLCNDTWFKFALLNIAKRVTIRRAGRPDLLLLHLHNTVRPAWARPASSCFQRQGCHPVKRPNGDFQLSKCILRHHFLINSSNFLLPSLTVLLLIVSKSYSFLSWYIRRKVQRLSQLLCLPVDSPLPECDCLFLFMFQQTAETVLRKNFLQNIIF